MNALFAPRIRAARTACGAGCDRRLRAGSRRRPGDRRRDGEAVAARRGQDDVTLRYYVETAAFVYRRADGTVAPQPPANAAAGDQLEITEIGYKGTHKSHAKKSTASSYTVCHFKAAKGAPTCEGVARDRRQPAADLPHARPAATPCLIGGTGRYAGATGGVKMTEIPDTNNSDVVVTVHLKK